VGDAFMQAGSFLYEPYYIAVGAAAIAGGSSFGTPWPSWPWPKCGTCRPLTRALMPQGEVRRNAHPLNSSKPPIPRNTVTSSTLCGTCPFGAGGGCWDSFLGPLARLWSEPGGSPVHALARNSAWALAPPFLSAGKEQQPQRVGCCGAVAVLRGFGGSQIAKREESSMFLTLMGGKSFSQLAHRRGAGQRQGPGHTGQGQGRLEGAVADTEGGAGAAKGAGQEGPRP